MVTLTSLYLVSFWSSSGRNGRPVSSTRTGRPPIEQRLRLPLKMKGEDEDEDEEEDEDERVDVRVQAQRREEEGDDRTCALARTYQNVFSSIFSRFSRISELTRGIDEGHRRAPHNASRRCTRKSGMRPHGAP